VRAPPLDAARGVCSEPSVANLQGIKRIYLEYCCFPTCGADILSERAAKRRPLTRPSPEAGEESPSLRRHPSSRVVGVDGEGNRHAFALAMVRNSANVVTLCPRPERSKANDSGDDLPTYDSAALPLASAM